MKQWHFEMILLLTVTDPTMYRLCFVQKFYDFHAEHVTDDQISWE